MQGEKIPHEEKVYSLFEPHTQWINKGKFRPEAELGHKLLVTTEEHLSDHPLWGAALENVVLRHVHREAN